MKTFSIILSLLALSVQANPLANKAESGSDMYGPTPDFSTSNYNPSQVSPDYGSGSSVSPNTNSSPVVPDYDPQQSGPNSEGQQESSGNECFSGLGNGGAFIGRGIRRVRCRNRVRARQGLLSNRFSSRNNAKLTEIHL